MFVSVAHAVKPTHRSTFSRSTDSPSIVHPAGWADGRSRDRAEGGTMGA